MYGQVAQLVEQRTENPRVGGSIPPLATIFFKSPALYARGDGPAHSCQSEITARSTSAMWRCLSASLRKLAVKALRASA
jgi:hypothetical protein